MKNLLTFTLLLIFGFACVPAKKYKALESDYQEASMSTRGQENQTARLESENKRLENELFTVRKQNTELLKEVSTQQSNNDVAFKQLQEKYDRLKAEHEQLKDVSNMEAAYNRQKLQTAQTQQGNTATTPQQQITIYNNPTNQNPSNMNPEGMIMRGDINNPNSVNNPSTSLLQNLPDEKPMTSNPVDVNKLYEFQNRLAYALSGYSANDVQVKVLNNQVYVMLSDVMVFENNPNASLSTNGKDALQKITQVILQQGKVAISVENEPSNAGENNIGYLKSQSIAQLFSSKNLACTFNNKNFSPLAYDTSGTQAKNSITTLVLSL
jgi:predicted RNase H-like nuclease (RuvC/YqgF family)